VESAERRRQEVSAPVTRFIRFGRFRVLPRARQLLVDGQPVELGSRAFDLLMVLIRAQAPSSLKMRS